MLGKMFVLPVLLATGMASLHAEAPNFDTLVAENPKLSRWLTVQMPIFGSGPEKTYTAAVFADSEVLWQNKSQAVYWATAFPPTEATDEEMGVLVTARRGHSGAWRVMKSIRLQATGLRPEAKAKLLYVTKSTSLNPNLQLKPEPTSKPEADVPLVQVSLYEGGRLTGYVETLNYLMWDDDFVLLRRQRADE